MYEEKFQEIFTQNDLAYHSASKHLDSLNQVRSYLSVKKKLRRVAESCPVCLDLYAHVRYS